MNGISSENETRLQELLDKAFNQWVEECDITCPIDVVNNIERIEL